MVQPQTDRQVEAPQRPSRGCGCGCGHSDGGRLELIFALLSGCFLITGWLLSVFSELPESVILAMYLSAYFFGGYFMLKEVFNGISRLQLDIDTLMFAAAVGAAVLGHWAEGALLLFLFSLGHSLEHYAMGRARRAIEALGSLAPKTALVRRDAGEMEVPIEELQVGETVLVRPNERLPCDGFVVQGASSVNQAPVTGESLPVDKRPVADRSVASAEPEKLDAACRVYAGTINGSGGLEVVTTKRSNDTTLARVVQMVTEAENQKSPSQRFADRFERLFVPLVMGTVVLIGMVGWLAFDEELSESIYRALAVLVAASPCALAIATPSAVLSGVARAGRAGVLVKGGGPLEQLGVVRTIAFDKTGTLTIGEPNLTDVVTAEGVDEQDLLRTVAAVERLCDHPLAAAVVRGIRERQPELELPEARDLESVPGLGVRGTIQGELVQIGNASFLGQTDSLSEGGAVSDSLLKEVERLKQQGRTTMIVRRAGRDLGALGLLDTPRPKAPGVIATLREMQIQRMVMLSGDSQRVADAIGEHVGIDEARGELMPEDKVEAIRRLREEQPVAMVGDGVNDAPAMAHATVGVVMGGAGSDVALETADIALMGDRLEQLPFAIALSRQTGRIIRQNLWISLGMIALLVPATIFGLSIGPAVAFHEGSTVAVAFNALRLLAFRHR